MNQLQDVRGSDMQEVQIGLRAGLIDLQALEQLAIQDRTSKSAVIRRLIHEEVRRRSLVQSPTPTADAAPC